MKITYILLGIVAVILFFPFIRKMLRWACRLVAFSVGALGILVMLSGNVWAGIGAIAIAGIFVLISCIGMTEQEIEDDEFEDYYD